MASPCRNPQRTLKSWRLLTESLKLFTLKLGRNQQLVWFKLPGRRLFCLEERRNLNDSLGQCIAGVSLIASVVRSCHLRLDVDRMLLIVEHGQLDGQLKIHEERLRVTQCELGCKRQELFHQMTASARMGQKLAMAKERNQELELRNRQLEDQTLDRSELFESRCVMLCGRAFDLSQELIQTRMRINDFENACTQLRRRILELKLRRVQRRRLLSELVLRLRKAQDQQVPPILWRLWHCMRFLWNCVECLGHPSGKLDAINWFMAGY
ncbi:uncharacterized protein LOC128264717 isoform X1 [Drosophila gunungcola]|uniref:uncharacterized protein LOC128264717 isoform X1 n=2 Tax=Drosophila gunungcola TaxID=103775 RepID=UPI0022E5192F|nr:uncharacterized protein LOC128264717 isoform X1 [Drosophila gunungcola]